MSQPIRLLAPAPSRRVDAAHRDRDLRRLLAMWLQIAGRYLTAQAHPGLADEAELADVLTSIEETLRERHRYIWHRLQDRLQDVLLAYEHADRTITAANCDMCNRIVDLPISVASLVDEARS